MKLYNRQYAFIIGISQYQKREYNLRTAEQDAREITQLLENEFTFDQFNTLYNEKATGSAIMDQLRWYGQNLTKDDALFIYFGGHGKVDKQVGYLIPHDGDADLLNKNNIFMTTLVPHLKNIIPARQIFFTIASCFSGEFLYTRSTKPEVILRDVIRMRQENPVEYGSRLVSITKEPARQVLTAGAFDEEMIDNWNESKLSPFAQLLVDGLLESADYLEASELANYIQREMNKLVDSKIIPLRQTPKFSDMVYKNKGCFVFQRKNKSVSIIPKTEKSKKAPPIVTSVVNKYSITDLKASGILEEYLKKGGPITGMSWFRFYEDIKLKFELAGIQELNNIIGPLYKAQQTEHEKKIIKNKEEQIKREKYNNMVLVNSGWYKMGREDNDDQRSIHKVYVDDFYIDKYLVTNQRYAIFLNEYDGSIVKEGEYAGEQMIIESAWGVEYKDDKWHPAPGYENNPVIRVSWYGAYEYARFYGKRLPTEAEWEYAARGGLKSRGYKYSGSDDPDDVAWYDENSNRKTHPVGQKQSNELRLYDMSGNVNEFCTDWYNRDYYEQSPEKNPTGPESGDERVIRGGSFMYNVIFCHSSYRGRIKSNSLNPACGFRCVLGL